MQNVFVIRFWNNYTIDRKRCQQNIVNNDDVKGSDYFAE